MRLTIIQSSFCRLIQSALFIILACFSLSAQESCKIMENGKYFKMKLAYWTSYCTYPSF
jgi:hypothetical protein